MAIYKQDIVNINLESGNIFRSFLNNSIGHKDDDADRFGIRAFRDGEPVDLSGLSCQAVFMAPNGVNIALTSYGTVSGNEAYVTLPPACYDYEGQFCLAIKLVGGGVTSTVRIVDGVVERTGTSGAVTPTSAVPTYQEILSTYDAMVAATSAANLAIAETFDATKAYPAGKYVINEGHLYRLTADHAANVTWANTSKVATNFGDDLSSLKSTFTTVNDGFQAKTSQTRWVEFNTAVASGDLLYINPVKWTGANPELGFNIIGYDAGTSAFVDICTATLGEEKWMISRAAYTKVRFVSKTSTSPSSDVDFWATFVNVTKSLSAWGKIGLDREETVKIVSPVLLDGKSSMIKYLNAMYAGDGYDIANDFEQGTITQAGVYEANNATCRTSFFYLLAGFKTLSFTLADGYKMAIRFIGSDGSIVKNESAANANSVSIPGTARYCKFLFMRTSNSAITPANIAALTVSINFGTTIESKDKELHGTILRDFSLVDSFAVNGYLNANGNITENANHRTTDFIFVKNGDKFDYSLVSGGKAVGIYNLEREKVAVIGEDTINTVCDGTYTVSQDGYVRFSNRPASYADAYVRFDKHLPEIVKKDIVNLDGWITSRKSYIQPYFEDEMTATIESVLALRTEPCLVFPIITDIHYHVPGVDPLYFDHGIENMVRFLNEVKCDFVLNLGDSSDGRAELATQIAYCNHQSRLFAGLKVPYYMVQGNHELNIYSNPSTGYTGDDKLTNEQIYTLFYNCMPRDVVYNPACFMDYYKDFDEYGIRLVVLNFSNQQDYKIADSTISWFTNTASNTDKVILLATHMCAIANHNSYPTSYGTSFTNMTNAIQAFINNGGTLINITGHSHSDFKFTSPWLHVSLNCQRCIQSDISISAYDYLRENSDIVSPARAYGTVTEDCWTVCVLRPLSRKIDFIRFGAGSDRKGLTY